MNDQVHPHRISLARIVDEDPTPDEAAHLASCRKCSETLAALKEDRAALASLADPSADLPIPPGGWERLKEELRSRGHLAGEPNPGLRHGPGATRSPGWLQLAAALLLVLGGGMGGWWIGAEGTAGDPGVAGLDAGPSDAGSMGPASETHRLVASLGEALDDAGAVELDLDEALRLATLTGELHRIALFRLRAAETHGGEWSTDQDAANRFAALDHLVTASRQAVRTAPTDPYLNGLLLDVRAERDLVLRQAGMTMARDPWF